MIDFRNVDCMELMSEFEDNHFDLAIVDPPYGIDADKKNSTDKKQSKKSASFSTDYGNNSWDSEVPPIEYFKELKRVSKHQIIWGINYYPYDMFAGGRIYWDKCVTMPTYSDGELAYCSKINSLKSFQFAWHGMIQGDMRNKEIRIHPTQKPVRLYTWLLSTFAKEGDKILDTMVGSGSSLIACHQLGFDVVGSEMDKDYYERTQQRILDETAQLSIF